MDVKTELILVYLAEDMSTLIQYWLFLSLLRITIQDQFLALATSTVFKVYIHVPNKNTKNYVPLIGKTNEGIVISRQNTKTK
jgi:hypothetical protein